MPIPIFVATRETLGESESDFCNAPEGAMVVFPLRFREEGPHDVMPCIEFSHEIGQTWTNLVKVAWFDGSHEDLDKKIRSLLKDYGYVCPTYMQKFSDNTAEIISAEAAKYPIGTILEYHDGRTFTVR